MRPKPVENIKFWLFEGRPVIIITFIIGLIAIAWITHHYKIWSASYYESNLCISFNDLCDTTTAIRKAQSSRFEGVSYVVDDLVGDWCTYETSANTNNWHMNSSYIKSNENEVFYQGSDLAGNNLNYSRGHYRIYLSGDRVYFQNLDALTASDYDSLQSWLTFSSRDQLRIDRTITKLVDSTKTGKFYVSVRGKCEK